MARLRTAWTTPTPETTSPQPKLYSRPRPGLALHQAQRRGTDRCEGTKRVNTGCIFSSDPDSYSNLFSYVFLTWKTVLALPSNAWKKVHVVFCISLIPQSFVWYLSGKQGSRLAIPCLCLLVLQHCSFLFAIPSSLDDACAIYGAEKKCVDETPAEKGNTAPLYHCLFPSLFFVSIFI